MNQLERLAAGPLSPWQPDVFALCVYTVLLLVILAALLFLCGWLGVKKPNPAKDLPYESGIIPSGSARFRYPVPFFLVAAFFLLFDVEGAFIFSWAAAFRALGWAGFLEMAGFIGVLGVSLAYIWKKGGLDWGEGDR